MYLQILVTIQHMNFNESTAGGNRSLLCRQSDYKHEELATLEDETTTLSRNVGKTVPSDVASYPSRTETSDYGCFWQLLRKTHLKGNTRVEKACSVINK